VRTLGELVQGRPIFALHQHLTVRQAAQHMASKKVGAVPVVEGTRLVGLFSERDLVTRVVAPGLDPRALTIGQVMTREVIIAEPEETFDVALERMMRRHIRHLPVVSNGRLVGFVSFRDLVEHNLGGKEHPLKMLSTDVHVAASVTASSPPMWECSRCGCREAQDVPPERCPSCAAPLEQFQPVERG